MAKFCGKIGYTSTVESTTSPGVWKTEVVERLYYGDVLRNTRRWQNSSDKINSDLQINNQISILSDSFAMENLYNMIYVEFAGNKWKISDVSIEYPRIVLNLGGLYNV